MRDTTPSDIDPAARAQVRYHARRLARKLGFTRGDREDLEQELALHVLAKGSLFDPTRASAATFYACLVARKAEDLRRAAVAVKRDPLRTLRCACLDDAAAPGTDQAVTQADLRMDVAERVGQLEPKLSELAKALACGGVAAAGRSTGGTRGQVRHGCTQLSKLFLPLAPAQPRRKTRNSTLATNP